MRIPLFNACLAGILLTLRLAATAQPNLSTPEGTWAGKLQLPGASLRIVLHVKAAAAGAYTATLDSPDQGAKDIPATRVVWKNDSLQLEIGSIGGSYAGKLNADSLLLTGHWRQGGQRMPLNLKKTDAVALNPSGPKTLRSRTRTARKKVSYASTAATSDWPVRSRCPTARPLSRPYCSLRAPAPRTATRN
jgi:hypothetical protein